MYLHSIYDFLDYRDYLRKEFSGTGEGRGRRSHLAQFLNCQTSFLSQVLTDRAHLSLEHAIKTSDFLKHNEDEMKFFMLLVQKGKAGTKELEHYFESETNSILKNREEIKERVKVRTKLNNEDQMKYYSSWHYLAAHILSAIPGLNTLDQISRRLKIELKTVKEAMEFLENRGFVKSTAGHYSIGLTRLHLPKGAAMLPRHHSNWRIKAIESFDFEKPNDLHYSVVLGISKKDQKIFKEKLLKLLEEFEPVIQSSKEELPVVLLMDLFEI